MTLCPYKWFLYIASVWALVYVMVEAWMQLRGDNNKTSSSSSAAAPLPNYADHPQYDSDDSDDDDSDDEEDDNRNNNEDIAPSIRLRKQPTTPTTHTALAQTFPFKLFS